MLVASCSRPTLGLTVNGEGLGGREFSYCHTGPLSATCADGLPDPPSFHSVAAGRPIEVVLGAFLPISAGRIQVERLVVGGPPVTGPGYDVETGATLTIPPLPTGRYLLLVSARYSLPLSGGSTDYAFGIEVR